MNCVRAIFACFILNLVAELTIAQDQVLRRTALSPEASLACIELADGFEIDLIANEPQVIDPVDAAFDDRGRLWVVEMRDYPFPKSDARTGRIRILSDEDGDEQFEQSTVFIDQLDMPTGVAHWKDGVVVTLAGRVVWIRDTDGDSVADVQQVWMEGFARDNEQLRANHPRLGPDGWWYIASGLRGGDIVVGPDFRAADAQPLKLGSRDVRFHPLTGEMEAVTGPAQFGLCFDSSGDRIFCSNRNPAVLVRIEQEDLIGNPLTGLVPSVADIIPAGEKSKVHPLIAAWTTSNLHEGQFTAACGVFAVPARTDKRGKQTRVFVCEPTGSLVHSRVFDSLSHPVQNADGLVNRTDAEWLASRDPWFRPVNVTLEPGGGIAVVDMHRAVIEHPQWVPDELKNRPDERWGDDCGRIYVVRPSNRNTSAAGADTKSRLSSLGALNDDALSQLIRSENEWFRETARRLLLEREAFESIEPLTAVALDQQLAISNRICALQLSCTLASQKTADQSTHDATLTRTLFRKILGSLKSNSTVDEEFLRALLKSARRYAAEDTATLTAVLQLVDAKRVDCLNEALLTVGECHDSLPTEVVDGIYAQLDAALRANLQQAPQAQGELLIAAAAAFSTRPEQLLERLLSSLNDSAATPSELYAAAAQRLTAAAIEKSKSNAASIIQRASEALKDKRGNAATAAIAVVSELHAKRQQLPELSVTFESSEFWSSIREVAEREATPSARQRGMLLLGSSSRAEDITFLRTTALQTEELPIRLAALRGWARSSDAECDAYLIKECASGSPRVQQAIVELIAAKPSRIAELAKQLSEGKLKAKAIGAIELKKLAARATGEVQRQLNATLATIENSDRAKVVASYQACLTLEADAARGKEVFTKHCASCHRVAGVGVQVGPDISDSRTQTPSQILTNILDPNRAIDNNYFRFIALTAEDQVIEGLIAEETSDAIVLRGQNDARTAIRRSELQELKATGVSLMPEGLEAQIDQQAMADLISFVKNWRYMNGRVPQ